MKNPPPRLTPVEAQPLNAMLNDAPERPGLPMPASEEVTPEQQRLADAKRLALENPAAVANIVKGRQTELWMGNLDSIRDWGYAPEYTDGMWRMLQADEPDTFVLATNRTETVRDFVRMAFKGAGIAVDFKGSEEQETAIDTATGKTVMRGVKELRVKESDRVARVVQGLRALGVQAEERPDGMIIEGGGARGPAVVDCSGDHRLAMSFAVAGLVAPGGVELLAAEPLHLRIQLVHANQMGRLRTDDDERQPLRPLDRVRGHLRHLAHR